MSNPSLIASLGIDASQFRTGLATSSASLKELDAEAKKSAASIALFEQSLKSGASAEQIKQLDAMRKAHRELQVELKNTARQQAALDAVAGDKKPASHGNPAANVGEMAHSGRAVLDSVLAGQDIGRALQMELPRVVQAQGGGLGSILGIGAAFAVVNQVVDRIGDGITKAREMGSALREAMAPGPSQGSEGVDAMTKRIEGLDTAIDAAKPKVGAMAKLWQSLSDEVGKRANNFVQYFGGGLDQGDDAPTESEENEYLRNKAIKERAGLYEQVNAQLRDANDLEARALDNGAASVKIAELRLQKARALAAAESERGLPKLRNEIDEVRADPSATPAAKEARVGQIQEEIGPKEKALAGRSAEIEREFALREKLAAREQDAASRSLALERELLTIKREGAEVEVKSAEARLRAATAALAHGPQGGNGYEENAIKKQAAQDELDTARRAHQIHTDELDVQKRIADFRGSADAKHLFALTEEAARLQRLFEMYKDRPDQQRGVAVQLASNQSAQADFAKEYANRQDTAHLNTVEAGSGRGTSEALKMIAERISTLHNEMLRNSTADQASGQVTPIDGQLYAQQLNDMHKLVTASEDVKFAEQQRLGVIQAQTREMEGQAKGQGAAARARRGHSETEQAVAQATHDHPDDPRYADEAQRQGDARQQGLDAAAQDEAENPKARAAAARAATRQEQQAAKYQDGGATHDADADGSAVNDAGWNGKGSKIPTAGNNPQGAADARQNGPADFTPKHMPKPEHMPGPTHMPDRSFTIRHDAAQIRAATAPAPAANNAGGTQQIVGAIDKTTAAVNKLSLKNH